MSPYCFICERSLDPFQLFNENLKRALVEKAGARDDYNVIDSGTGVKPRMQDGLPLKPSPDTLCSVCRIIRTNRELLSTLLSRGLPFLSGDEMKSMVSMYTWMAYALLTEYHNHADGTVRSNRDDIDAVSTLVDPYAELSVITGVRLRSGGPIATDEDVAKRLWYSIGLTFVKEFAPGDGILKEEFLEDVVDADVSLIELCAAMLDGLNAIESGDQRCDSYEQDVGVKYICGYDMSGLPCMNYALFNRGMIQGRTVRRLLYSLFNNKPGERT